MTRLNKLNATDKALLADRWSQHVRTCAQCAQYNPEMPQTLSRVCVQGAPVIKELLVYEAERNHANKRARDLRQFKKGLQGLPEVARG